MADKWTDKAGGKIVSSDVKKDYLKKLERDVVVEVQELRRRLLVITALQITLIGFVVLSEQHALPNRNKQELPMSARSRFYTQ